MNKEWSVKNKQVQELLKKATFSEGIKALLELRGTLMNEILSWKDEMDKQDYCAIPFIHAEGYHNKTIAYSLWHIFRIEDIVAHTLIQKDEQVFFSGSFQEKTNSPIISTGNELVEEQIAEFSRELNVEALYEYILEVKRSTDEWLRHLDFTDLKTGFGDSDKAAIRNLNVVSMDEHANWLIDYWCNKDIKGLIQMPFSRHWIMHIEASLRIKNKIQK